MSRGVVVRAGWRGNTRIDTNLFLLGVGKSQDVEEELYDTYNLALTYYTPNINLSLRRQSNSLTVPGLPDFFQLSRLTFC